MYPDVSNKTSASEESGNANSATQVTSRKTDFPFKDSSWWNADKGDGDDVDVQLTKTGSKCANLSTDLVVVIIIIIIIIIMPISVAERSKARVYGRSLAGIAGSNPAGDMNVCLLWVLCVVKKSLRRTDPSSRVVLPNVVRHCLWSTNLEQEAALTRVGLLRQKKKVIIIIIIITTTIINLFVRPG